MENKKPEIYLIVTALVLAGFLIIYNAISSPPLVSPVTAYIAPQSSEAQSIDETTSQTGTAPESSLGTNASSSKKSESSKTASSSKASSSASVSSAASNPPLIPGIAEPEEYEEDIYININTADIEEFIKLPNIGNIIAQRIIDYRETYGSFLSVDDLLRVDGIGENTLEKIRPYVYVG